MPATVGVPEIAPVEALRDRPAGSAPVSVHVGADEKFAWVAVALKGDPTCPAIGDEIDAVGVGCGGGAAETAIWNALVDAVWAPAVAVSTRPVVVPTVDGVPVIAPVAPFSDSPAGSVPASVHVGDDEKPDAVGAAEKAVPT